MAISIDRTAQPARIFVTDITMKFERSEALLLWHILRRVGCPPSTNPKDHEVYSMVRALQGAFENAFDGDTKRSDLNSIEVLGGKATLRTRAMAHLEPEPGWWITDPNPPK